jgi:hypothetical protein
MTKPTIRAGLCAAAACLAALAATAGEPFGQRETLQDLSGTWASAGPEDWYGAYGKRVFGFDDGRWTLAFTFALDPDFEAPVFRFRTGGPYAVHGPSVLVPGAFEATFFETAKHVTLLTADAELAAMLGIADCGLTPGVEADISERGCAGWKPVAECSEDHDLLAIDAAGGLYFGVRPVDNDMCDAGKRPTALLPAVVRQ